MTVRIINQECREGMAAMDAAIARNRIASDAPLFAEVA